jgi:hypothetical protein
MQHAKSIQQWFKDERRGSLMLPEGWYGRAYDSQPSLTSVDESNESLTLILEKKLNLHFDGFKAVERQNHDLVFGPYEKFRFEWESFGNDGAHGTKEYRGGEVKIVAAKSKKISVNPRSHNNGCGRDIGY